MTSTDHIGVSMGIDLNPFSQAITKAKSGMKDFSEHTSEHMDRAATSGRRLHRMLTEISSISPEVGMALTGAFSLPLLGVELLMKAIEGLKEHFADVKKSAEEARVAIAAVMSRQTESYIESKTGGGSAEVAAMKKDAEEAEKKISDTEKKITKAMEVTNKASATVHRFRNPGSNNPMEQQGLRVAEKDLADATAEEKRLNDLLKVQIKDQIERKNHIRDAATFEEMAEKSAKETLEAKKKALEVEKELDRVDKERTANLEHRVKVMQKAKEDAADLNEKISEHMLAPLRPSMSDLVKNRGPYQGLAKRIEQTQELGKRAAIAGRKDIFDSAARELYGYDYDPDSSRAAGGIAQRDVNGKTMGMAHHAGLIDQLRSKDVLAPDNEMKEMVKHLSKLEALASGKGVKIDVGDDQ